MISTLRPGTSVVLRGLVIARAGPKRLTKAFLTTITLRDEKLETINLTVWSNTELQATHVDQLCRVGFVLDVAQPSVLPKTNCREESYDPVTSSRLKLKFNQRSRLQLVTRTEAEQLHQSLATPYYLGLETLSLEAIRAPEMRGQYCSLLVSIQSMKPQFEVNGRQVKEVRVFDDSHDAGIMKLWEQEQRRVAEAWQSRDTVVLLSNVLIEFDPYRGINVIAGSSRSVITVDPNTWYSHELRGFAKAAAFPSVHRLETFVAGTLTSVARSTSLRLTVAEVKQLSSMGSSSEASALQIVSILAKMTFTNLLDETCVTPRCRTCGCLLIDFADTLDCDNFSCPTTTSCSLPVHKYTVNAAIIDPTGSLSDLLVSEAFMVELLGEPQTWVAAPSAVKVTTNKLVGEIFKEIFLALELPLHNSARPLRGIVVSAN